MRRDPLRRTFAIFCLVAFTACDDGARSGAGSDAGFEAPLVEVDITGDWWMLRYHYVVPGEPQTPADLGGVSFTQMGDQFTQFADGDPDFAVSGVIEGGTRYVQTDGSFTAKLGFTDENYGTGTFEQGAFTFAMSFLRRGPATFAGDGAWVVEGSESAVEIDVADAEIVVTNGPVSWRGRVAGDRALLVDEGGGADEALELVWEGQDRFRALAHTRAGGALSQRAFAIVRPGAPNPMGDITPPTVTDIFPQSRDGSVWPDARVAVTFSEPIDPATLSTASFVLHPLQPVDGVTYAAGEGLAGEFEVDGTTVTFNPARGELQEYETEYELTLTAAITDLAGNPLTPPGTRRFRTLQLAQGGTYRITLGDGRALAVVSPGEAETLLTIKPAGVDDESTRWRIQWAGDNHFAFASEAIDPLGFVEGGDGNVLAAIGPYVDTLFSGQVFIPRVAAAREGWSARQSPSSFYLVTNFQGPDRGLGLKEGAEEPRLVMRDIGAGAEAWHFERVGDARPTACAADDECGAFGCWESARRCLAWCNSDDLCGDGATCEDGGVCRQAGACEALAQTGECDGETFRTCADGEIIETDCGSLTEGRRRFVCRQHAPDDKFGCVVALGAECRDGFALDAQTWPCEAGAVCQRGPDRWECELSDATCDGELEPYCDGDVALLLCTDYGQPLAFNCSTGANGAACEDGACSIPEGQGCFDTAIYRCQEGLVCSERNLCEEPPVCDRAEDCGDVRLECVNGQCELRACELQADCGQFDCVYGECRESCQDTCEARWGAGTWVCDAPGGPCTRRDCDRSGDCPDGEDCVPRGHNRIGPRSTDQLCQGARQSPCNGLCADNQLCSGLGGDSPQERCR